MLSNVAWHGKFLRASDGSDTLRNSEPSPSLVQSPQSDPRADPLAALGRPRQQVRDPHLLPRGSPPIYPAHLLTRATRFGSPPSGDMHARISAPDEVNIVGWRGEEGEGGACSHRCNHPLPTDICRPRRPWSLSTLNARIRIALQPSSRGRFPAAASTRLHMKGVSIQNLSGHEVYNTA